MKIQRIKNHLSLILYALTLTACSHIPSTEASFGNWTLRDYISPSVRNNTWAMMSERFQFKAEFNQPAVLQQIHWFKQNKYNFTLLTKNARPYLYYVYSEALKRHIPPEIALLPMVESNYNPFLYSPRGATGLWQMMPGTATGFGLKINWWYDGRRDIVASTNAALNYLTYLHGFFGDWLLAAAAYNAGEGTVQQAVRHNKRIHKPTDYWHLALPAETKNYIPKLLAIAAIIEAPNHYHIKITAVKYEPTFSIIPLTGQYNLSILAKMANISISTIRKLNPGFRRFATTPDQSYLLLIPVNQTNIFNSNLAHIKDFKISWTHYKVQAGDNLSQLAHHYHTKAKIIQQINHLTSNQLQLNQSLLIPATGNKSLVFSTQNASIAEDHIPGPKKFTHTVKASDSLWSIAKSYHIRPSDIIYWNKLHTYHLKIGEKLVIWIRQIIDPKNYFIHTVRRGDSLSSMAKHFGVSEHLIRLYNNKHNNNVKVGEKLKVPYRRRHQHYKPHFTNQLVIHYVNPGDSISSLAGYYRVSKQQIRRWNHLKQAQLLKLNQPIRIYFSS